MLATTLISFTLRQVLAVEADGVLGAVSRHFTDHSRILTEAIRRAHDRAWQALAVALAGDTFLERAARVIASGEDRGLREQVQTFLQSNATSFAMPSEEFRRLCLQDLHRLRKSPEMTLVKLVPQEIAQQATAFRRHSDPSGMIEDAQLAMVQVADSLAADYPHLAQLLRTPTPTGPPMLLTAFLYFFRREVETHDDLAHGLLFDGIRQLSAGHARGLSEINRALASLDTRLDNVLDQLGTIEVVLQQTHDTAAATKSAVLDLHAEWQRISAMQLTSSEEIRNLLTEVIGRLDRAGMPRGEVSPTSSFSLRTEEERRVVKTLLSRYRLLPTEEQQKVPALLNGLGKLQVGAGYYTEATESFREVARVVQSPLERAEAFFNTYWTAVEQKAWGEALNNLRRATELDPERFSLFPLHRYEPKQILGVGGFGTAILCHDKHFDEDVVIKTLHGVDLERGLDEVFREARILRRLTHRGIIAVQECEYADPKRRIRPYLVMEYFPGRSLDEFLKTHGTLNVKELLTVARQIAEAMCIAHEQGILHRDLKPANLLVRSQDSWEVKIIDFGLALRKNVIEHSLSRDPSQSTILGTSVAGTMKYAPPEQLGETPGVKTGPYSDIYAFGKTCCHALFGTTQPTLRHWSGLPTKLAELLGACIEPKVGDRPTSFVEVCTLLGECESAAPVSPVVSNDPEPPPEPPTSPIAALVGMVPPPVTMSTVPMSADPPVSLLSPPQTTSPPTGTKFTGWDGELDEMPAEEDSDHWVIIGTFFGLVIGAGIGWFVKGFAGALLGGLPGLLLGIPLGYVLRGLIRSRETVSIIWIRRGVAWQKKKNHALALMAYRRALRIDPESVAARTRLASLLMKTTDLTLRNLDEAIHLASEACEKCGGSRMFPWRILASASEEAGRYEEALSVLQRLVEQYPGSVNLHNSIAWLLATCPKEHVRDGARAVAHAQRACDLSGWKKPYILDTLAASYAEAGIFDKAAQYQQLAMDLAGENTKPDYQTRLDLYRQGQKFRRNKREEEEE